MVKKSEEIENHTAAYITGWGVYFTSTLLRGLEGNSDDITSQESAIIYRTAQLYCNNNNNNNTHPQSCEVYVIQASCGGVFRHNLANKLDRFLHTQQKKEQFFF